MDNQLFISHASKDKDIVDILANIIKRVSLDQIKIWYSSDTLPNLGVSAGDTWFEVIRNNIKNSKAVVPLITPNSNNQPWLLYESGFADALNEVSLIPVKYTIRLFEITSPLLQKQVYDCSNLRETNVFLTKLLSTFNLNYDKDVFSPFVAQQLQKMQTMFNNSEDKDSFKLVDQSSLIEISNKLDSLYNYLSSSKNKTLPFDVIVQFELDGIENKFIINIDNTITVADVLDSIYFIIKEKVKPYDYLNSWVLINSNQYEPLILKNYQSKVPASIIFTPGSEWDIKFLDTPIIDLSYNHDLF